MLESSSCLRVFTAVVTAALLTYITPSEAVQVQTQKSSLDLWSLRSGAQSQPSSNHHQHKLANAVGDPEDDSSGADSDDSEDVSLTDSDFFYEELDAAGNLVGLEDGSDDDDDDDGHRISADLNDEGNVVVLDLEAEDDSNMVSSTEASFVEGNVQGLLIREALSDVLYLPSSRTMKDIWAKKSNAMRLDVESKRKLDRRGLYRALLLEIVSSKSGSMDESEEDEDTPLHGPVKGRRYINDDILYKLKAAISLASQPKWRQHSRASKSSKKTLASLGVSFFDSNGEMKPKLDDDETSSSGNHLATQSMQEIVTMALAHCYNCGFIILDDNILSTIRNNVGDEVKNSDILRELFALTHDNILIPNINPLTKIDEDADIIEAESLAKPIVVFLRTDGCGNLLKSKICVDILQKECLSENSQNLVVLGREPPFFLTPERVTTSPPNPVRSPVNHHPQITNVAQPQVSGPNVPVGKNDPEGSQRFNIFLIRLPNKEDEADGHAKIMGILAPAEAGNLFPQIVSNVGPETLDNITKIAANNNTTLTYASVSFYEPSFYLYRLIVILTLFIL